MLPILTFFGTIFAADDSSILGGAKVSKFRVQLDYQHPNNISKKRCDHFTQSGETTVNQQYHFCCNNPKFGRERFLVRSTF
jgi:hypothetical protein